MKIIEANKKLSAPICLQAMKGFYLLVVPVEDQDQKFKSVFIGDGVLVLLNDQDAVVVKINHKVSDILKRQMQLVSDKPNVLGVLMELFDEETELDRVSFVSYHAIDRLDTLVTKKQRASIMKLCGEKESEKV